MEHEKFLSRLLSSVRTDEVREILAEIGDRADIGLDEQFGHGFR